MQAVVCHGPRDYRLEEVAKPRIAAGQVLVRVEAVGICASDLKCYDGAAKFWGDATRPAWAETGVIPGHEFVGEIVELDDRAAEHWNVSLGDRVVSEQIVPCWKCRYCLRGSYHMCRPHDIYGFKRRTPGAMAPFMVYPVQSLVHRVAKHLDPAHAAFVEPLSCSLHAVERADIRFGDAVVVAGCGPIGLGMIAGASAKHPGCVIALDLEDEKLALALACGADLALNITRDDVAGEVARLTEGYGADVYLEASGHPAAVEQGLGLLRKQGTFVEYSVFKDDVTTDWSVISDDKELDVLGAHLGPNCWPTAIAMIESGRLPMDRICTHQLPLAEFEHGLELVRDGTSSIKVSLMPS